ncbi:hypothetical protein [Hymenobacter wooponensis]|uniref:Uncharacterized protein n=1 Tax=Hymenobacter wooponensis TaxID=1525360 RepID=A0A4Z0MKH9_9BACT|nr:hypothetical protein [Hymenobacter wooponensis]TGD80283.1 hypothetical protein EU557_10585 [Hymenobacter wooponensis]
MKLLVRSLSLSALLALGAATSAFTPSRPAIETRSAVSYTDYVDGYTHGKKEAEENKCIDGAQFQYKYTTYYHPWAERNRSYATTPEEYDYWNGYVEGMEEGYNTPVVCGSPGGGGGGTGPGGGGGDGPYEPVFD